MAESIVEAGNAIRGIGSVGGNSAGTYTRTIRGSGRYLLFIQRTNGSAAYIGIYYLQTYLRSGNNASSNRANLVEIKAPTSGLTSITATASTSDDSATITYVTSAQYCFCYMVKIA